jgi:hypothetical protein
MALIPGLFFGICMGVGFNWLTPSRSPVGTAVGAAVGGVMAWRLPGALERQGAKARAASSLAADQMGRSSPD